MPRRSYIIAATVLTAAALAALWRITALDIDAPALMLVSPDQAAECRDGGGCLPWSMRELGMLQRRAHDVGARAGVQWAAAQCGRGKT